MSIRSSAAAAERFGTAVAGRGIELVYGGASVGLMGVVADAALAAGGRATGVITESLAGHEIAHETLSDLHVVSTMHERKALMSELADAFVMLPGGFGTYEEFMESVTWAQLGIHDKACGILNVDGFFDDLLVFVRHAVAQGFIKARQVEALVISDDIDDLLTALAGSTRDQITAREGRAAAFARRGCWGDRRGSRVRAHTRIRGDRDPRSGSARVPQAGPGSNSTSRSSSVSPQSARSSDTEAYGFSAPVAFSRSDGV